jgi:hypothetical protein
LKKPATDNHPSLLCLNIIENGKKFYNIRTCSQCDNLFSSSLKVRQDKLEHLSLASLSSQVYYFRACLNGALSGPTLKVRLLGLRANITSSCVGFPGTNTLAYFAGASVTKKKKFCNLKTCRVTFVRFGLDDCIAVAPAAPVVLGVGCFGFLFVFVRICSKCYSNGYPNPHMPLTPGGRIHKTYCEWAQ